MTTEGLSTTPRHLRSAADMAATPSVNEKPTTFTPGPWEVIDGNVVATQFKGTKPIVMPDGETRQHQTGLLALVYSPGDLTLNFEANARLIAAAPDLLDALKTILQGFADGVFVRDLTHDAEADWALRLVPFI